jgi:hypothetical protein
MFETSTLHVAHFNTNVLTLYYWFRRMGAVTTWLASRLPPPPTLLLLRNHSQLSPVLPSIT